MDFGHLIRLFSKLGTQSWRDAPAVREAAGLSPVRAVYEVPRSTTAARRSVG